MIEKTKPKVKLRSESGMQALVRLLQLVPFGSHLKFTDPIFEESQMIQTLVEEKYCRVKTAKHGILIAHNDIPDSSANDRFSSCFVLYDKPVHGLTAIDFTKALAARFDYIRVECFGNGIMLGICENLQTAVKRIPVDYLKPKEKKIIQEVKIV